jgi:biuret amidohydrolase
MESYVYGKKREVQGVFDDYLQAKSCAVISIDMHRGHLEDSAECPCPGPRARTIIEPIDAFHRKVRSLGVKLVHVRTVLRPNSIDDANGLGAAWRRTMPLYLGEIPNAAAHAIQGSKWTDFMTEVVPGDHLVETKKRLSIFYPTDLDFLLRNLRVDTVVLNGGFTDCCVLNAAFDASNRDYKVIVLRDLVRGMNEEMEDYALKIISLYLGAVMDSNDLISEWTRLSNVA